MHLREFCREAGPTPLHLSRPAGTLVSRYGEGQVPIPLIEPAEPLYRIAGLQPQSGSASGVLLVAVLYLPRTLPVRRGRKLRRSCMRSSRRGAAWRQPPLRPIIFGPAQVVMVDEYSHVVVPQCG
jgi:hypothetical protein